MAKEYDVQDSQALVIDSNATSRSILVAQLRQYGVNKVVQCNRIRDARARLEHTVFDYVLCEQYFAETNHSGQTLLDVRIDGRSIGPVPSVVLKSIQADHHVDAVFTAQ